MTNAPSASTRRPLYTHGELLPLIRPASVAVVGASETKDGFGTRALQRMATSEFSGPLYAVHPKLAAGSRLHGAPTVRSLREIDGGVDCVLVAVPAAVVENVILDAAESDCRSAIIFSAGFGEASEEGRAAQQRIMTIASEHHMRLGGPNTAGVINYRDAIPLTFVSDLAMHLPVGNLAIVSQSAGLATHLGHIRHRRVGCSYTITTGNSVDVTALDYVSFLLDDDATDVVALVLEGMDDPIGFAEVGAKALRVGKPIVMVKCGRTEAGGRAAVSHTGSLAGNYDIFLAAARQAGIIVVETTEELGETAAMFAKWAGRPYQPGATAVITTMGGPGVMAADAAADAGVDLPPPSAATGERLGRLIPSFAAISNPIDTTASPTDPVLCEVILAVADDPAYAVTVMLAASMTGPSTAGRPAAIVAAAERMSSRLAVVWLSSWKEMPGTETLDAHPLTPVFRSSDRCMRAITRWHGWHEALGRRDHASTRAVGALRADVQATIDALLTKHAPPDGGTLDEAQSRDILRAIGIEVPRAAAAVSASDAAAAATEMGFPVVAKVISADVPHKAAVGGVELGLTNPEAVSAAYTRIMNSVAAARPDAHIDGVLIAESLDTTLELMCGVVRDPVFGPVVVCGAGGGAVELINDVAQTVLPVTPASVAASVRRLRIWQRLRRTDPVRAEQVEQALAEAMLSLSTLAAAAPQVLEVDVNPLVLRADGTGVALDGLVLLAESVRQ